MKHSVAIGIFGTQLLLTEVLGLAPVPIAVHDVVHAAQTLKNEAENVTRHIAVIDEWQRNYKLITDQLEEARRLKELIGNPQKVVKRIATDLLEGNSMDYFWEQKYLYWKLKEEANGTRSLAYGDLNKLNKLYKTIAKKDVSGNPIERDLDYYKRHDVVERQAERIEEVNKGAQDRKGILRGRRRQALQALKDAKTQADIQAVTAELLAINGECDEIEAFEADEFRKLQCQRILNEERKEKESQDALERYVHEECLANNCVAQKLKKLKFRIEI